MKTWKSKSVFFAKGIFCLVTLCGVAVGQESARQEQELLKVFSLSSANASELTHVLQTALGPIKHLVADERTNTLIIKANPETIDVVATLVTKLDEPHDQLRIFALAHATASELQNALELVFRESAVGITADNRTNRLVVKANAHEMDAIASVVQALDIEGKPAAAAASKKTRVPPQTPPRSNQVEIRSQAPAAARIKSLIADGTKVKKGDLLVELDDSELKAQLLEMRAETVTLQHAVAAAEREIAANQSKSVEGTKAEVGLAELRNKQARAARELEQAEVDAETAVATKALEFAELRHRRLRESFNAGQAGAEDVMEAALEVIKAKTQIEVMQVRRKLLTTFTFPLQIAEVEAELERAKARLHREQQQAQLVREQATAELDTARIQLSYSVDRISRLEGQLDQFKIYAPAGGTVQVASQIKKGAVVRQGQQIILLNL